MALTPIPGSPFRINSYITALRGTGGGWEFATSADPLYDVESNALADGNPFFWYPRLDRMYSVDDDDISQDNFLWWDPNNVDHTNPAAGYIANGGNLRSTIFCLGEWNKASNTQAIYGARNTGNSDLLELNHEGTNFDLVIKGTGWPFHPGAAGLVASTGIGSGTIGSRFAGQGVMVIFETWGYAIIVNTSVRHTDNIVYTEVMGRIDLATGLTTIEPIIASYDSSPHAFQGPTRFGNTFAFSHVQFVPDGDSTLAQPKGRLFMSTNDGDTDLRTGVNPGAIVRVYCSFVDFNPFGKSATPGNPNRVHGRESLFSRYEVIEQTEPESGGIGVQSGTQNHETAVWFHEPTQTIKSWYTTSRTGGNDEVHVQFSLAPVLDTLSRPVAQVLTEEGRTIPFEVSAFGDLGEPIPNFSVDWTLQRASTFEESLNTLAQDPTNTVSNFPIDPVGQLDVRYLGTLLTEGVDYTVVRTTGVITWAGSHSPPNTTGYTVTYAHQAAKASPPFGTLLNSSSKTDQNGKAIARVQYDDDDDLVGMLDHIDGSASAP